MIGVIDAGLIGRKRLKKVIEHADFELVGIADVNSETVSAQYPGIRFLQTIVACSTIPSRWPQSSPRPTRSTPRSASSAPGAASISWSKSR
ncbi:Gfo/Idh/MocA family oxidoreductase [Sinorhizobium meliloti]|uniref:Gfo/Idh/MocA family oxidoreductase n=1 Tax=Rhizobium meliloti TaxID=382 RepID=UPI001F1D87CA|nr:Gfo/Idh/MocA family oxidoreductase [Sinorhizobium meliloti]